MRITGNPHPHNFKLSRIWDQYSEFRSAVTKRSIQSHTILSHKYYCLTIEITRFYNSTLNTFAQLCCQTCQISLWIVEGKLFYLQHWNQYESWLLISVGLGRGRMPNTAILELPAASILFIKIELLGCWGFFFQKSNLTGLL